MSDSFEGRCCKEFTELSRLGCGSFGGVFKVKSMFDTHIYAIKKIPFNDNDSESLLKEVNFLTSLDCEFVVKFYDSWTEANYYQNELLEYDGSTTLTTKIKSKMSDQFKSHLLHIQMEYCPLTLYDIINKSDSVSHIEYYLLSELLIELLECVNYLHSLRPPVIHRDLKPKNILLSYGENGNFIKLTDFGLSTIHEFDEQSHTAYTGSFEYMAPEVVTSRDYNIKADIYSLAVCMQKMFKINMNRALNVTLFPEKYHDLIKTNKSMLNYVANDRPSCAQILNENTSWLLSEEEVKEMFQEKSVELIISDLQTSLNLSMDDNLLKSILTKLSQRKRNQKYTVSGQKPSNMLRMISESKDSSKRKSETDLIADGFICQFKYKQNYSVGESIGNNIFKAMSLKDGQIYAIRKTGIKYNKIRYFSTEIERLKKLDQNIIVPYDEWWIEENYYTTNERTTTNYIKSSLNSPDISHLLHIKMPLYALTLRNIIDTLKTSHFDYITNTLTPFGYFVASQLFIQIVNAVKYLHEHSPQILHCNLKPENIMLSLDDSTCDNFVRLSDIRLSVLDSNHNKTFSNYNAPEVNNFRKYSAESDVYSLGVIAYQLFVFNFNRNHSTNAELLQLKHYHLTDTINRLMSVIIEKRPKCAEILKDKSLWSLCYNDVCETLTIKEILTKPKKIVTKEDNFIVHFIRSMFNDSRMFTECLIINIKNYTNLLHYRLSYAQNKPIFISYARKDASPHARSLKTWLNNYGCDAYLDVDEIKVGNDWQYSLNNAVISCVLFVALVTPTYGTTKWTKRELQLADTLNKTIIPISFVDNWPPVEISINLLSTQNFILWKSDAEINKITDITNWNETDVQISAKEIVKHLRSKMLMNRNLIFLSYTRKDGANYARSLKTWLNHNECDIYLDVDEINAGYDWRTQLNDAVYHCVLFVALVTPQYGNTKWTKRQLQLAESLYKPIIPISFIDNWPPVEIAINLLSTHFILWKTDEDIKEAKNSNSDAYEYDFTKWEDPCVQRIAKEIADKMKSMNALKTSSFKNSSLDKDINTKNGSHSIVISCHPKQHKFANQICIKLAEFGKNTWMSFNELNITFASLQPNFDEHNKTFAENNFINTRKFRSEINKATVVILVVSEDYSKSRTSKQQAFYCDQRLHVIAIKYDNFQVPYELTKVYEEENIIEKYGMSHNDFIAILKVKIDKLASMSINKCEINKFNGFEDRMYYLTQQFRTQLSIFDDKYICVYIASSSKPLSNRAKSIQSAIGKRLASISQLKLFYGSNRSDDFIIKRFDNKNFSDPNVYHILPNGENALNGQTLNVGQSAKERDSVVSQLIDICLLIDSGEEAILIAQEFSWNDKFVIPVIVEEFDEHNHALLPQPIRDKPIGVKQNDWNKLFDSQETPENIAIAVNNVILSLM